LTGGILGGTLLGLSGGWMLAGGVAVGIATKAAYDHVPWVKNSVDWVDDRFNDVGGCHEWLT